MAEVLGDVLNNQEISYREQVELEGVAELLGGTDRLFATASRAPRTQTVLPRPADR